MWRVGDTFRALDTKDIRDCHIVPGASGRIEGIIGAKISFHLEKSHPKQGFTEGWAAVGDFGRNFAPDKSSESNRRQTTTSSLYPAQFPDAWRRPSGLAS